MSELRPAPGGTAAKAVFGVVLAGYAFFTLATAYQHAAAWSLRTYQTDPVDSAWRLELSWLGAEGAWSGRDFHYPRGPLWQAGGALSSWLSGADPGGTLGLLYAVFGLACLGTIAWVVVRHVRSWWGRGVALGVLALFTAVGGVDTFRGFFVVLPVLTYAPVDRDDARWRPAIVTAVLTVVGLWLSFDRFVMIGLSVAAITLIELGMRARRRDAPLEAIRRAARYGAALAVVLVLAGALLAALGFDLLEYAVEQRRLASEYSTTMAVAWEVAIPAGWVRAFFAACVVLVVAATLRRDDRGRTPALWLAGALPAALFGAVRADDGHVGLAMLPALTVLVVTAAGAIDPVPVRRRVAAGVLAVVAAGAWTVAYPEKLSVQPAALANAWRFSTGAAGPDRGYDSDVGAAWRWLERHRDETRCVGVSATIGVLHPLTRLRGPTELGLRWSPRLKRRLAERIREARCRYFLYSVLSFEVGDQSWSFGEDFLEVVRRYRAIERVGGQIVALERRDEPLAIERDVLVEGPIERRITLPGRVEIPLGAVVEGTDLLRVRLTLRLARWRAMLGGAPQLEWRFERHGRAVSPWIDVSALSLGDAQPVWMSPDTEAAEWRWITGALPTRQRRADTLAIRARPLGTFSPDAIELVVHDVSRLRPPTPPVEPVAACEPTVDLAAQLRDGGAYARWLVPDPLDDRFRMQPPVEGQPLGEILFPVVPCEESCFHGELVSRGGDGTGDGAEIEAHVFDQEDRVGLARLHVPPNEPAIPVQWALGRWEGRRVLLRFSALHGERRGTDEIVVLHPRIAPCDGRRRLADAFRSEQVVVARGGAWPEGASVVGVAAEGAEIRWPTTIVANTCLRFSLRALDEGRPGAVRARLRVADGDVEHVLFEADVPTAGPGVTFRPQGLWDWDGRRVAIVWDLAPPPGAPGAPARIHDAALVDCE